MVRFVQACVSTCSENQGCQLGAASHHVDHTVPSVPVEKRSRCVSFERHSAVTIAPGCIFTCGLIRNHFCQPGLDSHHVDHTAPSVPVANKSRCVSLERHSAVTVAPGCIFTCGLIRNHFCQPGAASHHVDHTAPSVPVANKSRWVSLERHNAVTFAPGFIFTWGLI